MKKETLRDKKVGEYVYTPAENGAYPYEIVMVMEDGLLIKNILFNLQFIINSEGKTPFIMPDRTLFFATPKEAMAFNKRDIES